MLRLTTELVMREGVMPTKARMIRDKGQYRVYLDFQCIDYRRPQLQECTAVNLPVDGEAREVHALARWMDSSDGSLIASQLRYNQQSQR